MGERNRAYEKFLGAGEGTDRLQFFSDAVFAIAMTLLVIDITVPQLNNPSDAELWQAIGDEWQKYLAYAISFAVIGVNWVSHHRRFRLIPKYDSRLIQINLLLLLVVAFVPFPTSLISEYGSSAPAVILYAATVAGMSLLQFWQWSYAYSHGLTEASVTLGLYRYVRRNQLVAPVVFGLSIPVAMLLGGYWPMYFWILNWPISMVVARYEPKDDDSVEVETQLPE